MYHWYLEKKGRPIRSFALYQYVLLCIAQTFSGNRALERYELVTQLVRFCLL